MKKNLFHLVFDRKKRLDANKQGKVELVINLKDKLRKFVLVGTCKESDFETFKESREVQSFVLDIKNKLDSLIYQGKELTFENVERALNRVREVSEEEKTIVIHKDQNFLDWMHDEILSEQMAKNSLKQKLSTYDYLAAWGKIETFGDLTVKNIVALDEALHDGSRTDVTIYTYHKNLKKYINVAIRKGLVERNPYARVKISKGKSPERKPLSEEEVLRIRNLDFHDRLCLKHAQDLFIFSTYTGLAYIDAQNFDFESMAEKIGDLYYIDGSRVKTGSCYFTPILNPAYEVLKAYDFKLPKMSNQKLNLFLSIIKEEAKLKKRLTSHIARHTFATMCLSHKVPIERVSRMLGHRDTRVTQIYAKISKDNISEYGAILSGELQ